MILKKSGKSGREIKAYFDISIPMVLEAATALVRCGETEMH
jgi:hypothetical protein